MKSNRMLLIFAAAVLPLLPGCANRSPDAETETTVQSNDRVVKDVIPAEGQRKIPVVQQYGTAPPPGQ